MTQTLMPVADARARILAGLPTMASEQVALTHAHGRVLAEDVAARVTQPPLAVSAMDGYAVRAEDVTNVPVNLTIVGAVPAGGLHEGVVGKGEAVRIFTGAALPDGADAIVIQEDTDRNGDTVTVIKDLKVKGSSLVVKVGTRVKGIRLVDGDHDIDCKIPGVGAMKLKSQFVKK